MTYVDGYLTPVPIKNRAAFEATSKLAAEVFKEHGASSYVECWADDVPDGASLSMGKAVGLTPNEAVIFTWIVWPSKKARDSGHEKVRDDPRMQPDVFDITFDVDRMISGGFVPIKDA